MKKFVVERHLPGAGQLTPEELQSISQTSCEVISEMGRPYHWIQSFITDDKIIVFILPKTNRSFVNMPGWAGFPFIRFRK